MTDTAPPMDTPPVLPVIAIVGRPNVGKSTLFNALTKGRDALVADQPGLTRDRRFGRGRVGPKPYILVDTGGLTDDQDDPIGNLISAQALRAVAQSDAVLFLVDGREGLTALDQHIAQRLREFSLPLHLVVNKAEGFEPGLISADFQSLGLADIQVISAAHRRGLHSLMEHALAPFPESDLENLAADEAGQRIRVAVIGRPNVGKSTLVNRLLGEERQLTYDQPGTTRDSIAIPFEREGQAYLLIDTAGLRRRARVRETLEKFSAIKALEALEAAHVVIMLFDAREGVTDQDANLLGLALESGRALVLAVNKWDGLSENQRQQARVSVERKLHFLDFAKPRFISALHGSGVGNLFQAIQATWQSAFCQISTPRLNKILGEAVAAHAPPLVHGRRIKLRYAHQGGQNPPRFVIHGNQTDQLPDAYRRYLVNFFRQALALQGTPLRLEFRQTENPYRERKNTLTPRQIRKRKRLIRHVKG